MYHYVFLFFCQGPQQFMWYLALSIFTITFWNRLGWEILTGSRSVDLRLEWGFEHLAPLSWFNQRIELHHELQCLRPLLLVPCVTSNMRMSEWMFALWKWHIVHKQLEGKGHPALFHSSTWDSPRATEQGWDVPILGPGGPCCLQSHVHLCKHWRRRKTAITSEEDFCY